MIVQDKVYIGREEAYEVCLERGIDTLPRKGKEIVTVKSNYENAMLGRDYNELIGKDENGYYLAIIK